MAKGKSNYSGYDQRHTHLDARSWRVHCSECGREFEAQRADAQFCSVNCRKHKSRAPIRKARTIEALGSMAIELDRIARTYKSDPEVFAAMQQVERALRLALSKFENDA